VVPEFSQSWNLSFYPLILSRTDMMSQIQGNPIYLTVARRFRLCGI
jgi:hypothetical protein